MQCSVAEVREQVHALQRGGAGSAQAAGRWLAQFQQAGQAVPVSAALLEEALAANDPAAAFFAAHTLAARARLCRQGEASGWLPLVQQVLEVLQAASLGRASPALSGPALRQLCVALARLAVQLVDEWPDAVDAISGRLGGGQELSPMLEVLQALAEEPFSRRLLVDGSLRSRFLLALRGRVVAVMEAIGISAGRQPGVAPLRCAAAWLRAQAGFEEWLPMVAFNGGGCGPGGARASHPALAACRGAFSPLAVRAARLELGPEAFEAAAALLEVACPLAGDLGAEGARETVAPLLAAFLETCAALPTSAPQQGASLRGADHGEAVGVLLTVLHAAFSSTAVMAHKPLQGDLFAAGAKLLILSGPGGGLEMDSEGGLLGRAFDAWEVLRTAHWPAGAGPADGDSGPEPGTGLQEVGEEVEQLLQTAFNHLTDALPAALLLPHQLAAVPEDWDLPRLRARAAQLLTVWVDASERRTEALFASLTRLCQRMPSHLGGDPRACAMFELVFTLGAAAAEAIAGSGDTSTGGAGIPKPLPSLLQCLPTFPAASAPAPWAALLEGAIAEFICALDPWIAPSIFPLQAAMPLVALVFRLAGGGLAPAQGAEALATVVSNLAPELAGNPETAQACFSQLRELCLGGATRLPAASRERLVRSALGPLLSRLPEPQLRGAVEAMAGSLRLACEAGAAAERLVAARLLFHLLAAPEPPRPELPLEWLSHHWSWVEAAVASPGAVEATTDAACHALTTALSRARAQPVARQALLRALPWLSSAAAGRGSAGAVNALATLVRVFRGGGDDEAAVQALSAHIAEIAQRLLGGPGAPDARAAQLPPDLLAALLELLTVALGARCPKLAGELLRAPGVLLGVTAAVAAVLHACASPRIVCWGLLFCERLPHWLGQPASKIHAGPLLEASLPGIAAACCRLLASSPVAQDGEVCGACAKLLLALSRALPGPTRATLEVATAQLGIPVQEAELLLQQVADPMANEEGLAEALKDTADSWQVEHLRRLLAS